jgi:hypothetical protein
MNNYISARSFAKKVKRSPTTISKWCKQGRIPGALMIDGTIWLIPKETTIDDVDVPRMGRPPNNGQGDEVTDQASM